MKEIYMAYKEDTPLFFRCGTTPEVAVKMLEQIIGKDNCLASSPMILIQEIPVFDELDIKE